MIIEIQDVLIDLDKVGKIYRNKKWIYFQSGRSAGDSSYPITIHSSEFSDEYTAEKYYENIKDKLKPIKITAI